MTGHRSAALALACLLLGLAAAAVAAQETQGSATAAAAELPTLRAHRLRGLTVEAVSAILGEPGGELAIAALATPLPGTGERATTKRARVPLWVEIDGSSLLAHNQAETARVEVYAYALDQRSSVAAYLAEAFALDVGELGEAVWQSGLKFRGQLQLLPGRYSLRVLVRLRQSAAAGLTVVPLEVPDVAVPDVAGPDGADLGLAAARPLFAGPRERDAWLAVEEWAAAGGEPFAVGRRPLRPAARPVLVAGRPAAAHLFAPQPFAGEGGRVRFLAPAGAASGDPAAVAAIDSVEGGEDRSLHRLTVRFTPPELAAGEYALEVELGDGAAAERSTAATVFVVEPQSRGTELLWTDLRWMARPAAEPAMVEAPRDAVDAPADEGRPAAKGRRFRRLATDYREVLATLAAGSEAAARDALYELESRTLGLERGADRRKLLLGAQLQIARELAAKDPESLIPVLAIHDRLHRTYSQRRLYALIFHARSAIEILAEAYVRAGGSPTAAAGHLAGLAGHLQRANLPSGCRRLFHRALDYDPRHPGALLGLAASYEKYGDYLRAVEFLETLAAARPGFGEGLLRLAVNHRRTGGRKRSQDLLRTVVDDPAEPAAPPWVRSLAYQELARGHLTAGALDRAAALLEEAAARLPGDAGVAVLLAHVYDRLGRPSAALGQAAATAVAAGTSPRMIYDTWPRALLDAGAAAREEAAARHREILAWALASEG